MIVIKERLQELIRSTYGNSESIDDISPNNFIGNLNANIELWCIKFSYTTVRDNEKERRVYLIPSAGYENVEQEFWEWVDDFNTTYSYKKISNVKILDVGIYETFNVLL